MHAFSPCFAALMLGLVHGVWAQTVDPLSEIISQALSVYTEVRSALSAQATAKEAPTTSSLTSSLSTTSSLTSSSSSTSSQISSTTSTSQASSVTSMITSTQVTQSASNTAEAAAASSSTIAAISAARAHSDKNRTIAIALGVVLGLLALAALIGLLLFCLRRRRRQRTVGSRRSLCPEAVDGAAWGKENFTTSSSAGTPSPARHSTLERHGTSLAAGVPLMTENAVHRGNGPSDFSNSGRPIPAQSKPDFQPGLTEGASATQGPQHTSQGNIPPNLHSPTNASAADLGGAVLGGLAATQHPNKHHDHQHVAHDSNNNREIIRRKPIGGTLGIGTNSHSSNTGIAHEVVPGYQADQSGSPQDTLSNPFEPSETTDDKITVSLSANGSPPAHNGSSHPLFSNPYTDDHGHTMGKSSLISSATVLGAGAGAGDAGVAPAARKRNENRGPDSSLTGRRSWDHNRQSRTTQSILGNAANRRSTGSTIPYVQSRSPKRTRMNGDLADRDNHAMSGNGHHVELLAQNSPYPNMERPQLIHPDSFEKGRNGSAGPISGSWRGSGEFNRPTNRKSFSKNDNITSTSPQFATPNPNPNPPTPSLSELRRQEEEGWYRGRYMGDDVRTADSGRARNEQRFYTSRGVGQAI